MKAWPWMIATAVLATVLILYITGALNGTPLDFSESDRLRQELQDERERADSIQYTHQREIELLRAQNDSLVAKHEEHESAKTHNTEALGDRVRIIHRADLDTLVSIISEQDPPPGY